MTLHGPNLSIGIYGQGMHDFVIRELEIGQRAASCEDSEACGFGPLLDAMYLEYEVNGSGICEIDR